MSRDAFTQFEHRGWQHVADRYDSIHRFRRFTQIFNF
jgi:hypothetical protein